MRVRLGIVEKAIYYYESGLVFLDSVTKKSIYFKVGLEGVSHATDGDPEKLVSFQNKGKGWVPSCTCRHGTTQGSVYGCICSHIMACIIWMYFKRGRLDI